MFNKTLSLPRRIGYGTAAGLLLLGALAAGNAQAAKSEGCEGGGFTVLGRSGAQDSSVPAAQVNGNATFLISGKYVRFEVVAATLGILNYTLTGAPNAQDITGGVATPVFASKLPDHKGLRLTSDVFLEIDGDSLIVAREGPGLVMKIQAKDCAQGGVFQMEVERSDETPTVVTHTLANDTFYFDNRNFRNREGDVVPYKDTTLVVSARVNFGNDQSRKFVGRDSPQVATRLTENGCNNSITKRDGSIVTVNHCGGVSRWSVSSGGRMGMVFGEDSTEVAPPATVCVRKCQAQNRVRGRSVVLGFPFPVNTVDRLQQRSPTP